MSKLITRTASVRWSGQFKDSAPNGGRNAGVRGDVHTNLQATSADIMASAHAKSFSLELAKELRLENKTTGRTTTTSQVTVDYATRGGMVTRVHLDVVASLPHISQARFIEASVRAKTNCLISKLLHMSISMTAKLEGRVSVKPLSPRPH